MSWINSINFPTNETGKGGGVSMETQTFYKRQCDGMLCAFVCVGGVQQLTAGDKPDPTSISEL